MKMILYFSMHLMLRGLKFYIISPGKTTKSMQRNITMRFMSSTLEKQRKGRNASVSKGIK
ncbi:hypothetical protein ES703_35619 [subsurface metagenome]